MTPPELVELAFAHAASYLVPAREARRELMGTIRLHNMMFYSYHGASRAERETGRRYEVDVEIRTDLKQAADTDRLADTINYTRVYDTVAGIILPNKFNLLETIAARITREIIDNYQVERVIVRVRKKIPPIPGHLDHIEVEFDSLNDVP